MTSPRPDLRPAPCIAADNTWGKLYTKASAGSKITHVPLKPLQFHFHSSSEHVINAVGTAPLEAHLVTMVRGALTLLPCAPSS